MNRTHQPLKHRVVHEVREYFVMAFYLYVVFALLITYKSLILSEHHIDFARHGVALISALALAKVMLTAQELHLVDWFGDAPLIYPTFVKTVVSLLCWLASRLLKKSLSAGFTVSRSTKASLILEVGHGRAS